MKKFFHFCLFFATALNCLAVDVLVNTTGWTLLITLFLPMMVLLILILSAVVLTAYLLHLYTFTGSNTSGHPFSMLHY